MQKRTLAYFGNPTRPTIAANVRRIAAEINCADGCSLTGAPGGNTPAQGETIYNALITGGLGGHVLGTATLTGTYSTTPAP